MNINTPILPLLCVALASLAAGAIMRRRIPDRIPAAQPILFLITVTMWSTYVFLHARRFEGGLHVGFFGNAIWNFSRGDFYRSDWFGNILGYHALFSGPILYLPARLFNHPFAFTALHLLYTASGSLAFFYLARQLMRHDGLAFAAGMLVLFNPYLTSWFLNPFTIYSPIFLLLPLAFLEGEKGYSHRAGAIALIAGLLLEDIAIGLFIYWIIERARKTRLLPIWFGIATFGILAVYYLALRPLLPHVGSEGQHLVATHDIRSCFSSAKIGFFAHVLIGTGGLCLLSPLHLLLTVADAGLALVSPTLEVHLINSPYLPALGAGSLLAAIYGLARVHRLVPAEASSIAAGLTVFSLLLPFTYSHSLYATLHEEKSGPPTSRPGALELVPVEATVATNDPAFYGWAIDRRAVYLDEGFFTWIASSSRIRAAECDWIVLSLDHSNSGRKDLLAILAGPTHHIVHSDSSHVIAARIKN